MGGGVDAQRQATGDEQTGVGEVGGELPGNLGTAGRRVAGADHGQLRRPQTVHVAMHEQQRRRVIDLLQQRRIARIAAVEQVVVRPAQPGQIQFNRAPVRRLQIIERCRRRASLTLSIAVGGKHRLGRTKGLQQPGKARRANAGRPQQSQQPGRITGWRGNVTVQGVVTRSCMRIARSACITRP